MMSGHVHVVIIDDDREHIGWRAVGTQKHEIIEILVLPGDGALHHVLDHGLALGRRLEADDGLHAGRRLLGIAVAPAPVVARRAPLALRRLAHLIKLVFRGVARIRIAGGNEAQGRLRVARRARELKDGISVPIEPEPFESVEDRGDGILRRTFAIRVLDAQQHAPAVVTGIEPVEKSGARATDVEKSRWGRGRSA